MKTFRLVKNGVMSEVETSDITKMTSFVNLLCKVAAFFEVPQQHLQIVGYDNTNGEKIGVLYDSVHDTPRQKR